MYDFVEHIRRCYYLLQDDLSRKIFKARLALDFDQSPQTLREIVNLSEQQKWLDELKDKLPSIIQILKKEPKKVVLYGTNVTGRAIAALLKEMDFEFYGFCGRRAEEFTDGLMGKPVISPDYLFQHPNRFYVIISACESADEIANILQERCFPQNQILFNFKPSHVVDHQYFDFPGLYPKGTAFIDGGCLNCRTSYLFVDWCDGDYSKIFAFEPDPISCSICERNLADREIRDFHLVRAGLSDHDGEIIFRSGLYGCSHIMADNAANGENTVMVPITTIDETVGAERIGFIKMDIEGSEFNALHGAKHVIVRDKPLLAISVYHRAGDMLAIMDYLRCLVPEYRFWLRHYSIDIADTVLYASVDKL